MTALPSIRTRLAQVVMLVSLAWGLTVSAVVWWVVQHEVDEVMDATLLEAGELLFNLLSGAAASSASAAGSAAPGHEEHLVWQLMDGGGTLIARSHRAPATPLVSTATVRDGFSSLVGQWRLHAARMANGRTLLVAQPWRERSDIRLEAAEYTAGAALLVGLTCALWLRLRVRSELRPLARLSEAVNHYDPLAAEAHWPAPERSEMATMQRAVTSLGERLAVRLRNERAFAAHTAHALRTPLAGIVMQLAAAQRVAPPAVQPMILQARTAADRLSRVVTALLAMFRSAHELHRTPVRLSSLLRPLAGVIDVEIDNDLEFTADPDLVSAALANLVDNAVRHGAATVRAGADGRPDSVVLWLHDDGPGIDDARRAGLQTALDMQEYDGHTGLGLMLADMVARAHGGRLVLPAGTQGFRVELRLHQAPA